MSMVVHTDTDGFDTPETPEQIAAMLAEVEKAIARKQSSMTLQEEAFELKIDFRKFIAGAWHIIEPYRVFKHNWHQDAICEYLNAVSDGHIRRLQIWVPPGAMKSRLVSVLWPAWEWNHMPELRYWCASYDIALSKEFNGIRRDLMSSEWYLDRWADEFVLTKLHEAFVKNNMGGHMLATSPESTGTGRHGHRIIFDDPLNAADADKITGAVLDSTNEWYSGAVSTRGIDGYAEIVVMQRLHQKDMAAHALQFGQWEVLCLPERFERGHPFAWRGERIHPKVAERLAGTPIEHGDPREEDELLWPDRVDDEENALRIAKLGRNKAAGQLQQRPSAREGTILPRGDWRYYPREHQYAAEDGDVSKLPPFRQIVISWDTSLKDKNDSDYVAGGIWGMHGADRFLLRTFHQKASLSATKRAMLEMREWARKRWPKTPIRVLIEKQSNGVEISAQLKKEIPGVIPVSVSTDKTQRAEAAEPVLNSHNVYVPGAAKGDWSDYDSALTPTWVQDLIEECAAFPLGANDDLVDMFTLGINWMQVRNRGRTRSASAAAVASQQRRRREGAGLYRRTV